MVFKYVAENINALMILQVFFKLEFKVSISIVGFFADFKSLNFNNFECSMVFRILKIRKNVR